MGRHCDITAKTVMFGNRVSHANNKNRRRFLPNLHYHRFWDESRGSWLRLRVSHKGMRTIYKLGLNQALNKLKASA